MSRRTPAILAIVTTLALALSACQGGPTAPALTDPKEIVTAALNATEAAKSVHLDVTLDGTLSVAVPGLGAATPVNLTGTTANADVDFAKPALKATFAVPAMLGLAGEIIAVDGKSYVKTTITGPLYQESAGSAGPVDPSAAPGMVDNLGDILFKEGVVLTKGDDVACGSKQCYTVSANLTSEQLGTGAAGSLGNLPVDLTGASLALERARREGRPEPPGGRRGGRDDGRRLQAHGRRDGLEMGRAGDDHRAARGPGEARLVGRRPPPTTTAG